MHESRGFVRACASQLDRGSGREKTLTKLFKRLSFSFLSFFYSLVSYPYLSCKRSGRQGWRKRTGPACFPAGFHREKAVQLVFLNEESTIIGPLVVALFRVKRYNFFSPFLFFPSTRMRSIPNEIEISLFSIEGIRNILDQAEKIREEGRKFLTSRPPFFSRGLN